MPATAKTSAFVRDLSAAVARAILEDEGMIAQMERQFFHHEPVKIDKLGESLLRQVQHRIDWEDVRTRVSKGCQ